ncbi:TIR domain-containing protein [Paenibacillus sp. FSL H7-0331]|uniref:TIR domain-containing protein n=1 Tax=Paenibacillus sp. FSL H7-0331 TaxID=1920421 RepID=UPI00096CEEA6|nr:TIR domain-containing protein [Paenibacillus sp. FSL H7-0331]OMF07394.1 hypothetical protein BK127_29175 [Paenibacillus sp. FSL H7-0331]
MDQKDAIDILEKNILDNVICRNLELKPGVIATYIAGLSNESGGYIFLGVEKDETQFIINGISTTFQLTNILNVAISKLSSPIILDFCFLNFKGENIFVIKVEKATVKILCDEEYYIYKSNGVLKIANKTEQYDEQIPDKPTLFLSYREIDTPIVNIIEDNLKRLTSDGINISRYTRIPYKASFKEFMNGIQDHDVVLCVVSDGYLRSQACMYEVGEIIKDHHFNEKLIFVVLSENERKYYPEGFTEKIAANIYGSEVKRLQYVTYWKEKYDELNETIRGIDDYEAISDATRSLKEIGQIYRNDISEFMTYLADNNGKSFEYLCKNEFKDLLGWISKK